MGPGDEVRVLSNTIPAINAQCHDQWLKIEYLHVTLDTSEIPGIHNFENYRICTIT